MEETRLRPGLSVPVVTVLDPDGALIEAEQRALVRYVVQEGSGADIVFAAGTTGEWPCIENGVRQRVAQICTEEVAKANAALGAHAIRPVESWAGITAPTARETLENLDFAIACGADAAVLAPLSVEGLADPVRFVVRDVSDLLDARPRRIPVVLYDNADIAADPRVPHIRTRQVKAMSRLDFVRGIKVSAPRRVLGHYTQAAAGFRERGEFGIYVGNAMLIFDLFRPHRGWLGTLAEHWNRYRLRGGLPVGVVAGHANVLPREWAYAWQVSRAGDVERMDEVRGVLETYRNLARGVGGARSIACLKRALCALGVIRSGVVAHGTPALPEADAARFDEGLARVLDGVRERIAAPWVSRAPGDATGGGEAR
ncbi:MAG TPA: dihydrodipicolinate synthase family protein [Myxococcota bacterium]